jgi:tetratricopeptide (TPR) repeat protein
VIEKQPRNAYAYFRRALVLKELKMYDEAAENLLFARDLAPEDPKLIVNRKQIYEIKYRKLC